VERLGVLYTRPRLPPERGLCLDAMTSLQPRPRTSPTVAALPQLPVRVEQEYQRCGALHLLAAFDPRSGQGVGVTAERQRQVEFRQRLALLDAHIPTEVRVV
jgi:hypothetical protein